MTTWPGRFVLVLVSVLAACAVQQVGAQTRAQAAVYSQAAVYPGTGSGSPDVRVLRTVYSWDSTGAHVVLGGADALAYPVIALSLPSLWTATAFSRVAYDDARSLTAGLAGAFATTMVLKRIIGRERPYAALPDIHPRMEYAGARGLSDSASFPSGHATLAGAIAAGAIHLSSHPAVIAGSVLWAGSVALSRVWLGVHYLSDVIVGLAIGAGLTSTATLVW